MAYQLMYSHHFDKAMKALSKSEKEHVEKALVEMEKDPHYSALRTKHLHSAHDLFESSANMDIRIIWHHQGEDTIGVLDVGHHDILKKY